MKIGQLITVLEDVKKHYGDKHLWGIEGLDTPLPDKIEIELTKTLKRTDYGVKGGKTGSHTKLEVALEFEDGVNLIDRCIQEVEDY